MNWLHRVIAVVMLTVWMPAASLCLVECAGFVERGDCCADESGGKTEVPNHPCCLLASGLYKSHDYQPLVTAPDSSATEQIALLIPLVSFSNEPASPRRAQTPPDLPVTWQFSFRAALPPRAPSLPS